MHLNTKLEKYQNISRDDLKKKLKNGRAGLGGSKMQNDEFELQIEKMF